MAHGEFKLSLKEEKVDGSLDGAIELGETP